MKNTARIAEHPLHPMLIPFPVGMFVTSFVFDLMYLGTGNTLWYKVAYYMIVSGIIGALVAALPGFVDYFTLRMSDQARNTATTHMVLNLSIATLFAINAFVFRMNDAALAGTDLTWALTLSVVSLVALAVAGWLGWNLVYKHGIGISVEDAQRELELASMRGVTRGMAGQAGGERPGEDE